MWGGVKVMRDGMWMKGMHEKKCTGGRSEE